MQVRLLAVAILAFCGASAAVVDRIAVTVGNQVITQTEILREIALTAFMNGDTPVFTKETRKKAADQLVEQKLVRREMQMGNYPAATAEQAQELFDETRKNLGGAEGMKRQLAIDGLTEDDVRQHLLWQLTLVRFIDLRFRPAIQVTAQDVQEYYRTEILPRQQVRFGEVREKIQETLYARRADQMLDEWLKHAKTTTRIEYKEEAFE